MTPAHFRVLLLAAALCRLAPAALAQENFFFDNPKPFLEKDSSFPRTAYNNYYGVVSWQETEKNKTGGSIYISFAARKTNESEWRTKRRALGPFNYLREKEPSIFSIHIDTRGRLFFCVSRSSSQIEIFTSEDMGETFTSYTIDTGGEGGRPPRSGDGEALVPRIFQTANGAYLLCVLRGLGQTFNIYYARSEDALKWTDFEPLSRDPLLRFNFLPAHISISGRDHIVFQSLISGSGNRTAFQLYIVSSTNNGRTWSSPRRLTDFQDRYRNTTENADSFNNERAQLSFVRREGEAPRIFMVWERNLVSARSNSLSHIYGAFLNENGRIEGDVQHINSEDAASYNPVSFVYKNMLYVLWFDSRSGSDDVFLGFWNGESWRNRQVTEGKNESIFPRPVIVGDELNIFWQNIEGKENALYYVSPDVSAAVPVITALNFVPGKPVSADTARLRWETPQDTSGIAAFSWSWGRDESAEPPKEDMGDKNFKTITESATEDGLWYFKVRARDILGNWSYPSGVVFARDKTPPPPPTLTAPQEDGQGFLVSNDFSFKWSEEDAPDLAGYSWKLDYIGPAGVDTKVPEWTPIAAGAGAGAAGAGTSYAVKNMGLGTEADYQNADDGLWRFTVYAIDEAGNVSAPAVKYFKANKYIPHTFITYIDEKQELSGDLHLKIIGRGFAQNGDVERVLFKKTDEAGWERVLELSNGDFRVAGDRTIVLRTVENLGAGNYYIYVEHPVRGMARSPGTIKVERSLTYKFGDFTDFWQPQWVVSTARRFVFDGTLALFAVYALFCALFLSMAFKGTYIVLAEGRAVRRETFALTHGTLMPGEKKKTLIGLHKRGLSLRLKLTLFTVALVFFVVVIIAAPLFFMMIRNDEETLKKSLWDRSAVLLNSIAGSARTFLPANNVLELGFLPNQASVLPEARYVTITGFGSGATASSDYVWASNDPDLSEKIGSETFEAGVSRITDNVSDEIKTEEDKLNKEASDVIGAMAESVTNLNRQARTLLNKEDAQSERELADIQVSTREIESRINETLAKIGENIYSVPQFDIYSAQSNETSFILFKPVMFRYQESGVYVRGWVRLDISSENIIKEIQERQRDTLYVILIVALIAMLTGAAGAFIVSTFIILPIRRLVRHVEMIRDTEDKSLLAGIDIKITRHDEIGILSGTINDMTHNLVKAALDSKDLTLGKEIQKKFIPLETDDKGNKLSTGLKSNDLVEFFGFYEGAKGVSGDYFDYLDLDGRRFAIIKCDVAGKGIPAALIMIQVATMFLNYFKNPAIKTQDMKLEPLVYQINDFIEQLGFKGRFAAFTLCLFDTKTCKAFFCNAGDNLVHYYDASEEKFKTVSFNQTPATGILPNTIIQSTSGYTINMVQLERNDILMMYTDGIEEAKRLFRDKSFKEIVCNEGGAPLDTPHGNHSVGQDGEEMGADRVEAIVNAVMRRGEYVLYKYHNPEGDDTRYHFDFKESEGRAEDVILALVSVEKIFRMRLDPDARAGGAESRVLVDKKIDEYLRKCFIEYGTYCSKTAPVQDDGSHIWYLGVLEDEQYDDLTILGMKRK